MDVVNELPRRLRARREGMGYSLQTIAARCQLAPQELEAIERGERAVHLVELERLSWTLGVHPGAFLAESAPEDDARLQAARFRAQQGAELKPDDRRLLSIASEAGRIGQFLWDLLHRPAPALRVGYTPIRRGQAPWKQGYDLGASARERLSPRAEPIPNLALLMRALAFTSLGLSFRTSALRPPRWRSAARFQ